MVLSRARWATAAGVVLGCALTSVMVLRTTQAALTGTTQTQTNSWTTGGAALENDAATSATAVFSQGNDGLLSGGQSVTRCIAVRYTGNSPGQVRLYASNVTGGLASYLDLKVETGTGTNNGCTDFSSAATLSSSTTVAGFGAGYRDWTTGLGSWNATLNSTQTYRFTVTVRNVAAAQNGTASAVFNWEAQTA